MNTSEFFFREFADQVPPSWPQLRQSSVKKNQLILDQFPWIDDRSSLPPPPPLTLAGFVSNASLSLFPGGFFTQIVPQPRLSAPHTYPRQRHCHGPELVSRKGVRSAVCADAQFASLIHCGLFVVRSTSFSLSGCTGFGENQKKNRLTRIICSGQLHNG